MLLFWQIWPLAVILQLGSWQKLTLETAPSPRLVHAIAYDQNNQNIVLYGGRLSSGGRGADTWILTHQNTWEKRAVDGPGAIDGHQMAYCPTSKEILLFGGNNARGILGESWTWNGVEWTKLKAIGPDKRWGHAMTSFRSKVLLFGGKGESSFHNDTWTWDGTNWNKQSNTGPKPRYGAKMHAYKGGVILYGGRDHSGNWFTDTWWWDGQHWEERAQSRKPMPGCSVGHYLVGDGQNELFLIGGIKRGDSYSIVWKWDEGRWTDQKRDIPFQLDFGAATFNKTESTIVITGTSAESIQLDTWYNELPYPLD